MKKASIAGPCSHRGTLQTGVSTRLYEPEAHTDGVGDLRVAGIEAGTATITVPGGRTENGEYVVVFKQVGGAWKIAYDINNTDQPAPPNT